MKKIKIINVLVYILFPCSLIIAADCEAPSPFGGDCASPYSADCGKTGQTVVPCPAGSVSSFRCFKATTQSGSAPGAVMGGCYYNGDPSSCCEQYTYIGCLTVTDFVCNTVETGSCTHWVTTEGEVIFTSVGGGSGVTMKIFTCDPPAQKGMPTLDKQTVTSYRWCEE